ncbi:MAG: hypothetical protein R3F40_11320 [Candidatus Competibacteraceae bacterium]
MNTRSRIPLAGAQQAPEQRGLVGLLHRMHLLLHQVGGRVARSHVDHRRLVQEIAGQLADRIGEGGREQQGLPPPGQ